MKLFSFLVVLVLTAKTGYAISLADMQEMALENRDLIQRFAANVKKSEEDIIRARSGYYPAVDFVYTTNTLDDVTLTEAEENSVLLGVVSWNIFDGFRDKYNIESAQLLNNVQRYHLQGLRQDIQLNVALRYLAVYERKANLKVSENVVTTLENIFNDGKSRLKVGLIDKNELLKFKIDLDDADINRKAAQASLDKSVHLLAREIDTTLELENFNFSEFANIPEFGNQLHSEQQMLVRRSEIQALQALVDASKMQAKAEYSDYYPKVDIEGRYRKYDDNYINGNGDISDDELRARLTMSINLFRGFEDDADIGMAKLKTRGLQYDLIELKDSLITELKNIYIDYKVSLENVSVAESNIELAKENLRITKLKYDEGLQRESDLLDAITNLSRAQLNYVTVIKTVFANHFEITRMIEGFNGR